MSLQTLGPPLTKKQAVLIFVYVRVYGKLHFVIKFGSFLSICSAFCCLLVPLFGAYSCDLYVLTKKLQCVCIHRP